VKIGVSAIVREGEEPLPYRYAGEGGDIRGAKAGTLIHLFMQHLDFSAKTPGGVARQAEAMEARRLLTAEESEYIRGVSWEISLFLQSELAYRIRRAERVLRELPFSLAVPARELGLADSEEKVVVQGIIDLVFEERDGLVLLDYKSNMADPNALAPLGERYKMQLRLYERALRLITGKVVKEKYLYFLRVNSFLELF